MRFTFRLKLFIGFILSMYIGASSGDFQQAMTLLSVSRHLGVEGAGPAGWAILFSYFVVGPIFIAILFSILMRIISALGPILGIRSDPRRRSPKFATRAQKKMQDEIVDAE